MSSLTISTTWGPITVQARGGKIAACDLAHAASTPRKPFSILKMHSAVGKRDENAAVLKSAGLFIRGLFNGNFAVPPEVIIPDGTEFQRKVWKQLCKIKPGQTLSYSAIARKAGRPKAFRAAGQVCGANPIPLFIPCHRVVTSNGALGGFSCGLAWKKLLLTAEAGETLHEMRSRRKSG